MPVQLRIAETVPFQPIEDLKVTNRRFATTVQTRTVVRLHNVRNSILTDNLITFARCGNAVAQTGKCSGNYYRRPDPDKSDPFDGYKE